MKKLFTLLITTLCISTFSDRVHAETILDDKDTVRAMITAGVPVPLIFAAKKEQTKVTIANLILAAAPRYPLEGILALYPNGEAGFFERCKRDPFFYEKFFLSLAGHTLKSQGAPFNPLEYSDLFQGPDFSTTDYTVPIFNGHRRKRSSYECIGHHEIYTLFKPFTEAMGYLPNLAYLKKLLELDLPRRDFRLKRSAPQKYQKWEVIREAVPYIRGEIAFSCDYDHKTALRFFETARQVTTVPTTTSFLNIKIASIKLGIHPSLRKTNESCINEKEGVKLLKKEAHKKFGPMAKLRLGQHYLGFFGADTIDEEKGIDCFNDASREDAVSHLAVRALAEYYLGVTSAEAYDLEKAKKFLDETYNVSDNLASVENNTRLREAEIALGVYDQEGTEEIDIPLAERLLKQLKPNDADYFLHRIYTGYYGEEGVNDAKAAACWQRLVARGNSLIQAHIALKHYKAGEIDQAIEIFERHKHILENLYFLGRIYANPKHKDHYDPAKALWYFMSILQQDIEIRDTRVRMLKLFLKLMNATLSAEHIKGAADYLAECTRNDDFEFSIEELKKSGLLFMRSNAEPDLDESEPVSPAHASSSSVHTSTLKGKSSEAVDDNDADVEASAHEQEDMNYLVEAIEETDEEAPLWLQSNLRLQALYDQLGSTIKWNKLLKIVAAFDGEIDMKRKTIKLPNSDIFTFHLPHGGNPLLTMSGYWRVLRTMLDHEYNVLCEEEREKAVEATQSASSSAAGSIN